jgi:NAD(P)-dependent dehydrogenase (short-subunit alcohol dehydrogenase family)
MVHLDVVRSCNAALVKSQPLVAVFTGGTAGIGSYAARALAAHAKDGRGLRLYIVSTGQFRFVQTDDLALLKNVDRVCAEIIRSEQEAATTGETPRIDLLIMTQGCLAFERKGIYMRF